MKRLWVSVLVCALFITTFRTPAGAQWWQDSAFREKLKLTEKQVEDMNRIFNSYQEKRIEVAARSKKLQLNLNNLLAAEKLDDKAADKALDALSTTRSQFIKEMVNMKIAVRKILTPEQVRQVLAEDKNFFSLQKRWTKVYGKRPRKGRVVLKKEEKK